MGPTTHTLVLLAALLPLTAGADPEQDVRGAVNALAVTSYGWATTVRQRFQAETIEPRSNPDAAIEMRGRTAPDSYTEITLLPSREALAVPVTAAFRSGDAVGQTPLGWLRRSEMRATPGPDRAVDFEGQPVRLSRAFTVALRAMALRPPSEELLDLIFDCKSYRREGGQVIADLAEPAIEKLWGNARATRAPELRGNVIFKLNGAGLSEYDVVLAMRFPNSSSGKAAWSMVQWRTQIKDIGSTVVDPPAAAVKRLEE